MPLILVFATLSYCEDGPAAVPGIQPGLSAHPPSVRIGETDLGGLQTAGRTTELLLLCDGHGLPSWYQRLSLSESPRNDIYLMDGAANNNAVFFTESLTTARLKTLSRANLGQETESEKFLENILLIETHHISRSLTDDSLLSDLLCPEAVLAVLALISAVLGDVL